jgi:hypothetical protein
MLLKCNDDKFVDFNDQLVVYSSTLKALKKYSHTNNITFGFCDSNSIEIIQEWLATRNNFCQLQNFKDKETENTFFTNIISVNNNKKNCIIIKLLKIADFLNISFLVDSLLVFISEQLASFSPSRINDFLNNKFIQYEHKQKIFFFICQNKFCNNDRFCPKFGDQEICNFNNYVHGHCEKSLKTCFSAFFYQKLLSLSLERQISLENFKIFDSLNSIFICYEQN